MPQVKGKSTDAAREIVKRLLAKKKNRDLLDAKYQEEFEKDPTGTVERLMKLAGKEKDAPPPKDRIGIDIRLTDDRPGEKK